MSTARASPSATRSGPPAAGSWPPSPARWPAATPATGWRRCASAVARACPRSSSESDCRRPGTDSRVPPVGRDAGLAPSLIPRHDKESHGYRTQAMTDEQRKSVALEYLKAFDNAGTTSTGGSILDLFADDAQVMFPKWGLATGKKEIGQLFADIGGTLTSIRHHYSEFTWIFSGSDLVVAECTSHGEHRDVPLRAGAPGWGAGRWCDVFEIRDFLIQRCFIYLDPDYAGQDTERYPWLAGRAAAAELAG